MVFRGREAHLFHMGDTLVFRLRGAEFEQLSRDHVTDLGGYRYRRGPWVWTAVLISITPISP